MSIKQFGCAFIGFLTDLHHHWMLAVRAVLIGWTVHYIALRTIDLLAGLVVAKLKKLRVVGAMTLPGEVLEWCLVVFFAGAITGATVALSHRKYRTTMLVVYAIFLYTLNAVSVVHRLSTDPQCCPPFAILLKFGYPIIGLAGTFWGGFLVHVPKTISEQTPAEHADNDVD